MNIRFENYDVRAFEVSSVILAANAA